jgi:hypothetical protein
MIWKETGDWYVDSFYGNDSTGTGTKENPFATAGKAHASATSGQTVVLSGIFSEVITNSKFLHWVGDGFCLFYGEPLATGETSFNGSTWGSLRNIVFYRYQSRKAVVLNGDRKISNCAFYYCTITSSANANYRLENNIFREVFFDLPSGPNTAQYAYLTDVKNNTFYNCQTPLSIGNSFRFAAGNLLINNHFEQCGNLYVDMPTTRPVNAEFDYNNIVDFLYNKDQLGWKAYGTGTPYQQNGITEAAVFNIDNNLLNDTTWFKSDFTLKAGVQALTKAKNGLHIGARPQGFRLDAIAIWNNRDLANTSNLELSTDTLKRIDTTQPGILWTNEIDLGAVFTCDFVRLASQIINPTAITLSVLGRVDYNIDAAIDPLINQKTTFDLDLAFSTTLGGTTDFKKIEFEKVLTVDSTGNGNADAAYNIATASRQQVRYVKFKIALRS